MCASAPFPLGRSYWSIVLGFHAPTAAFREKPSTWPPPLSTRRAAGPANGVSIRRAAEHWLTAIVSCQGKREDAMNEKKDRARRKPADAERDRENERRAREKALDQALEDTFPASDPVAQSEPAPNRD
jgi:hypothetical protein